MTDSTTTHSEGGLTAPEITTGEAPARKRPKPGERRIQILQTLAAMLQQPGADRITTAALAARMSVSEAALYRHFASKAQMFEGLIEFIEQSVFTLINQVLLREAARAQVSDVAQDVTPQAVHDQADTGARQAFRIVAMLMQFAETNPGMVRVMVGDALVLEDDRLQQRMNQFFDKIEAALRQCLRTDGAGSSPTPTADAQVRAGVLVAFCQGRLQRFVRSGFRRRPTELLEASLALILA